MGPCGRLGGPLAVGEDPAQRALTAATSEAVSPTLRAVAAPGRRGRCAVRRARVRADVEGSPRA